MAVKRRALPGQTAFVHELFQALAKGTGWLALSADSHREVAAPRKDPDVTFQARQELNIDAVLVAGHVIPQRGHGVAGHELRSHVAQRLARAGGHDAIVPLRNAAAGAQAPPRAAARYFPDARLFDLDSGGAGALQKHAVQVEPGVDHQRVVELQGGFAPARRRQNGFPDEPLGGVVVDEKRISIVCLVGQAAAARLLPGQLLVEQRDAQAGVGQPLARESSRGTAAQDRDMLHFFLAAGGRAPGAGIIAPPCGLSAPGAVIAPPCGLPAPGMAPPGVATAPPCGAPPASLRPTTTHLPPCCSNWYFMDIPCAALVPFA